jgi:P27 family predicted phage terminase small subunit
MAENIPARPRSRPGAVGVLPRAPKHLSAESRRQWDAIVKEWLLGTDGLLLLRGALESWDLYQSMRKQVMTEGAVVISPVGTMRKHPAATVMADAFTAYRTSFRQLGLMPPKEG